jgi:2-keto-4-pentenoate hydratase/2-oxohepta-3-ene-1,7-dioic acid hydratase in catechol pathway
LAVSIGRGEFRGYREGDAGYPGDLTPTTLDKLDALARALAEGDVVDPEQVERLPPLSGVGKIICIGLNYRDHSAESGFKVPDYPTVFARFESSLIGDGAALVRPAVSEQFDYEGELVAVIGSAGRHIPRAKALQHVVGYSIFNDASVRDVQLRTPQWTMGKNFDSTGAFGPFLVTADEVPQGARGLQIQTRLNGKVVQDASTNDLVFDIATLVAELSAILTLEPGDVIVTGTPSGVGVARKPPLWMKAGDVCEVEVEELGILRNHVVQEECAALAA